MKIEGRCANGYFIEPTIIEGLDQNCQTNQEEIFGPVVTIQSFKTEEEAIQLANATQYGLAASIWTKDISRANRVAAKVESGIIWINCWLLRDLRTPFGGLKNSGVEEKVVGKHYDFLQRRRMFVLNYKNADFYDYDD